MPKLTLNATELVEPDVDIVAMVKRGANRIPFRLTKKDDKDMLDLSKIGATLFAKAAVAPAIVGVVLSKSADIPMVIAALKAAGVDVEDGFTKAEEAMATTFTKTNIEASPEDILVLKLDDDVALTITGPDEMLKRVSTYDWESTSFSEVMAKGAFSPSLRTAQDMLTTTFYNIMEKADDAPELSTLIKTATNEFATYVDTLVTSLPESVFKAETEMLKATKAKKDKGLADDMDEDDAMGKKKAKKEDISAAPTHGNETPTQTGTKAPEDTSDGDIDGNPAVGNETPTNPPLKSKGPGGTVSNDIEGSPAVDSATTSIPAVKAEDDPVLAAIAKMGETLTAGLADVRKHVDTSVATVTKDVAGLAGKVAKTEAALEGTVIGDDAGDQTGTLKKSGTTTSAPPLLDTAYMKLEQLKAA